MHFLILAGMAAAFSAWTKNEGILFLVLLFFLHAVVTTLVEGRKSWIRQALALLTGAVPVSAVIFIYKLRIAAANGIIGAQGRESTIHNLLDVSRYRLILRHFEKELYTFGGWTPIFGRVLPLLLFFYFLLLGASVKKKDVTATAIAVLLPVFMMLGHFFVYILSPYDLAWHLDASLNRLFLQLWPVAIFAYFAILRAPEQAVIIYMESPQTHQSSASGVFGREIVIDPAPHHWWETHLIRRRSG
jgi:hypothetical protein